MDKEDLRKKALEETRENLKQADRDHFIVKAVKYLEEVERGYSNEVERFRDWYAIHFPELEDEIQDDDEFVKLLKRGLHRDELDPFQEMAENSTGSPLEGKDREMLETAFERIESSHEIREEIREYVKDSALEVMPNLSKLLDPILAAKVIAIEGSLEGLAKEPASTIQMLGAEKALFRYLRGEGTPPKHGVIFEHTFVSDLPEDKRGKMARFLGNKAAIAARLDVYGDKDKGKSLRDEAQEKYQSLKE
ncbi:hypothetical protein [Candidatus Nanohalococcus occultus]|uniref:hypothetical protein n=1 Tax=Candidatus Nanohalococcus occultus TaxID=2978047 RepID=UPI0039E0275F